MLPKIASDNADRIYVLLNRLGASPCNVGYHYVAYATLLALENPYRLSFVTKYIYPDVAIYFKTTERAVERGIRALIASIWDDCKPEFPTAKQFSFDRKPKPRQFISILVWLLAEGDLSPSSHTETG